MGSMKRKSQQISIEVQENPNLKIGLFILFIYACYLQLKNGYSIKRCLFSSQAWVEPPAGGIIDVPLAQTGEGIAECELLKWFVQEVILLSCFCNCFC